MRNVKKVVGGHGSGGGRCASQSPILQIIQEREEILHTRLMRPREQRARARRPVDGGLQLPPSARSSTKK